jgi:sulfoacetaldehyde dehydrogenase
MVEETGTGPDFPFSGEKLSPVLTVYRARDFDHACAIVAEHLRLPGRRPFGQHPQRRRRAHPAPRPELPVSRVIVNQIHCYATGGSFDNGLPFSLSMGCGTWGRNNFSDNMNYRHYLNITRISRRIAPREPALDEIFGEHFRRYGK